MIELYTNQRIGWRKRTGIKDNGAGIYEPARPADPAIIMGRFEYSRRLILNEKGEKVISEAFVMTAAPVTTGDLLIWEGREWPVQRVKPITGLMGQELHREVYL